MNGRLLEKASVHGAPVSCVSLSFDGSVVYALGCLAHRVALKDVNKRQQIHLRGRIHGVRRINDRMALFFGGRTLQIVKGMNEDTLLMERVPVETSDKKISDHWVTEDWIWDCSCRTENKDAYRIVVGMAHNQIQIWNLQVEPFGDKGNVFPVAVCRGSTRCILYCLNIGIENVAAGTVQNEILIWKIETNQSEISESHRLSGHKGVIHDVRFNETENLLASTSDDRSVRLWSRIDEDTWICQWTVFGHTARGWNVAFGPGGLVSTGEDGTTRLWDLKDGREIAVLRGHACWSIWGVDVRDEMIVTGGDNGTVALYQWSRHVVGNERTENGTWCSVDQVPDDRSQRNQSDSSSSRKQETTQETTKKKKKVSKLPQQVLVGMQLCADAEGTLCLAVVTRLGSIYRKALTSSKWIKLANWTKSLEGDGIDANSGRVMSVSSRYMAIGTQSGEVAVLFDWDKVTRRTILLTNGDRKAVQKVVWYKSLMVVLHVQSVCIWKMSELETSAKSERTSLVLSPGTKALVVSCTLSASKTGTMVVVGDSRGNICLFCLDEGFSSNKPLFPSSVLYRVHHKEHVNCIVWKSQHRLHSCGNDGCVHTFSVDEKRGELRSLCSVPVSIFTGIDTIWSGEHTILAGYVGNEYVVVDYDAGYEIFRVDTGGRQRSCDFWLDWNSRNTNGECALAVVASQSNGRNGITICKQKPIRNTMASPVWYSTGICMHEETIFDSCIFTLPDQEGLFVVTASEDCTSRVSMWKSNSLISSFSLPCQESALRAVSCCARHQNGEGILLAVAGANLGLQFFTVTASEDDDQELSFHGYGRGADHEIAHRYNTLAAVSSGTSQYVVAGDSNGCLTLFTVPPKAQRLIRGRVAYSTQWPILSLSAVDASGGILIFAGSTQGTIDILKLDEQDRQPMALLHSIQCHSMGTNCIDARCCNGEVVVCSGGDDQSLSLFHLSADRIKDELIIKQGAHMVKKEASISAIRGISWTSGDRFVCSGYAQEVTLWDSNLQSVETLPVEIGDVNSLSFSLLEPGSDSGIVAVCGAGVELIRVTAA